MLHEIWLAAVAGGAAGLGVAMPLGAIGALLLREGVTNGFAVAAAGAAGVALVDTAYCAVAMVVGAAVAPAVEPRRDAFLVVAGLLVIAIGLRQLVLAARPRTVAIAPAGPSSQWSTFVMFVGLTAVNPTTLVYFVALSGAVTGRAGGAAAPVVFVVAVGLASLTWQLALAAAGSWLGGTVDRRVAEVVGVVASVIVVVLGGGLVVAGLR